MSGCGPACRCRECWKSASRIPMKRFQFPNRATSSSPASAASGRRRKESRSQERKGLPERRITMTGWTHAAMALYLGGTAAVSGDTLPLSVQQPGPIENGNGLQLLVAEENVQPTLRIVLPDHPQS